MPKVLSFATVQLGRLVRPPEDLLCGHCNWTLKGPEKAFSWAHGGWGLLRTCRCERCQSQAIRPVSGDACPSAFAGEGLLKSCCSEVYFGAGEYRRGWAGLFERLKC